MQLKVEEIRFSKINRQSMEKGNTNIIIDIHCQSKKKVDNIYNLII